MNISNLQRAAQLAQELPNIDQARKELADEKAAVFIENRCTDWNASASEREPHLFKDDVPFSG